MVLQASNHPPAEHGRRPFQFVSAHNFILQPARTGTLISDFHLLPVGFRANLYQEENRLQEALRLYDKAIHFRPGLAGMLFSSETNFEESVNSE